MIQTLTFLALLALNPTVALAGPSPALGAPQTQCADSAAPVPFKYCITVTPGSQNPDLLYFFHGMGGNERGWSDPSSYTEEIRKAWSRTGAQPPTVIAISMGPVWFLVEKNSSPYSGLFEAFTLGIVPALEKSLGGLRGKRLLMGESMGGFNGIQLALKTRLFDRATILCPPVANLSPWADATEIAAYQARTRANPTNVAKMIQLSQAFMPTPADFAKGNPLAVVELANAASPELYVSCGTRDDYGFFEGAESFASRAQARGARVQWRPLDAQHCAADIVSVSDFLAK